MAAGVLLSMPLHDSKCLLMDGRIAILPARGKYLVVSDPLRIRPFLLELRVPSKLMTPSCISGPPLAACLTTCPFAWAWTDTLSGLCRAPGCPRSATMFADHVLCRVVFCDDLADCGWPGLAIDDDGWGAGQDAVVHRHLSGKDVGCQVSSVVCVVVE